KLREIVLSELGDRFAPRFNVQFRWHKWRNRRSTANPETGDVTAEKIVIPMINMMVAGVTRRRDRANFKRRNPHHFVVSQDPDSLRRHRRDPTPKAFHVVAENAGGRFD